MRKITPTVFYCDKCGKKVPYEAYLYRIHFHFGGIRSLFFIDDTDEKIEVCRKCYQKIKKFAVSSADK